MSTIPNSNGIRFLCRICLTETKNMTSLDRPLNSAHKRPLIIEALEKVVCKKVTRSEGYPTVICPICLSYLRVSYKLTLQFTNSEKVLLERFSGTGDLPLEGTNGTCEKPSPVEIIVGPHKYDLKDILIVEAEEPDDNNFKGFLDNLGKAVTAELVNKCDTTMKNIQEEEPVVLIGKVEQAEGSKNNDVLGHVVFESSNYSDEETKDPLSFVQVDMKDFSRIDPELFQSALNMQWKCNLCDRFYSSKYRYEKHLASCKLQHAEIPDVLKCDSCPRLFKQQKLLNYHKKTAHAVSLKYQCDRCGVVLQSKSAVKYHMLSKHGEKKFVCSVCNRRFFTCSGLNSHVTRHGDTAQCICPICGKTFRYKGGLYYHLKMHTNECKYCCDYCDRKFYTLNAKKRHTRTHTGERPYTCKYCDKRFFSTGELRKHEYLHTGVRPYSCQYCKKGFCSSYNMKVHLLTHPGPYACMTCDRTFVSANILQFHANNKHLVKQKHK
ncbi:hypothetical protein NQ315_000986 [Exocentrus adspersus]|uniref:Uncharacterized protein n=1 Tax=Exocentrus adspersus TaxID=1586481 RepID=A0AAV8WF34_9CUCU|nr:hypothetical protein NQ315_000986 [Exocentrus adspersus]